MWKNNNNGHHGLRGQSTFEGMGGQQAADKLRMETKWLRGKSSELIFISLHKQLCKLINVKEFMWANTGSYNPHTKHMRSTLEWFQFYSWGNWGMKFLFFIFILMYIGHLDRVN